MKAKVINSSSDYYSAIIDIKSINFKYVSGIDNCIGKKVKLPYEDVEFVYEQEWEKNIVKYRDILNVSLPDRASPFFYAMLSCTLEEHMKEDIRNIAILSDVNEYTRRKYWYKRIVAVINNNHPVLISASGKEYSVQYNVDIEDMDRYKFISECKKGINEVKESIEAGMRKVKYYENILNSLGNPGISRENKRMIGGGPSPF